MKKHLEMGSIEAHSPEKFLVSLATMLDNMCMELCGAWESTTFANDSLQGGKLLYRASSAILSKLYLSFIADGRKLGPGSIFIERMNEFNTRLGFSVTWLPTAFVFKSGDPERFILSVAKPDESRVEVELDVLADLLLDEEEKQ